MIRLDLNRVNQEGKPFFPELKVYAPEKYAAINALYEHNGLPTLDDCSIKVITQEGGPQFIADRDVSNKSKELAVSMYSGACCISKNRLLVGQGFINETINTATVNGIEVSRRVEQSRTLEEAAAVLAHEAEHSRRKHIEQWTGLAVASPFAVHGLAKGVTSLLPSSKIISSSIITSLLRIPQAVGIFGLAKVVDAWYIRTCEREADASVKSSAILARGLKSYLGNNKGCGLGQSGSLMARIFASHPSTQERAEYLEKWAKEAEAKKQQEQEK